MPLDQSHARMARMAQALLAVAVAFALVSWHETAPPLHAAGTEDLDLDYKALVQQERGPWRPGMELDGSVPGVPLDASPILDVTADYASQGVGSREAAWRTHVRIRETGDDGQPWWTVTRDLPHTVDGDRLSLRLDLAALVAEAQRLDAEARVPGRIDVRVLVEHDATVDLQGQPVVATRTAMLAIVPDGDVAILLRQGDHAEYRAAGAKGLPLTAAWLALAALALEPVARKAQRSGKPWQQVPGVQAAHAVGLDAAGLPHTDLPSLLKAAKRSGGLVLVDEPARLAVLRGTITVAATWPGPEPPAAEPEGSTGLALLAKAGMLRDRPEGKGPQLPADDADGQAEPEPRVGWPQATPDHGQTP